MDTLYLITKIAGQRVALSAEDVESVVEIETITPVPLVAAHIAGLAALRSRVLTIIDSLAALDLGTTPRDSMAQVVVVVKVEGHLYGLLVEEVEDVVTHGGAVQPVRIALAPGWARVARGTIDLNGDILLLLDPAALIAPPAALAA